MRSTAIPPRPSTETLKSGTLKTRALIKNYPEIIRCYLDRVTDDTFTVAPQDLGTGTLFSRFFFEIGDESRALKITDTWTLDFGKTDPDLDAFTGGLIDGIAIEDERIYLSWAFLDANLNFAGMALTRKPYTTFSAISTGSANKGTTRDFTVVNGFQFTIGARVAVTNRSGTEPTYQWNWGTINTVANTALNITMDDNSEYGFNLTSATSGRIIQWDKFRPFVVTGSDQTLFKPYYSLIGEIYIDENGDIQRIYRRDAEFRFLPLPFTEPGRVFPVSLSSGGPVSDNLVGAGRKIPLWAEHYKGRISIGGTSAGNFVRIHGGTATSGVGASNFIVRLQVDNRVNDIELDHVPFRRNAVISWNANNTGNKTIQVQGWYIEGGMRL